MDDPSLPETLDEISIWIPQILSRGAADSRSAFHWPTLATVTDDGAPEMRTIVLRAHQKGARRLVFYTDARSAKVAQLKREPRGSLHVYDAKKKVQLRLEGRINLYREGEAWDAAWDDVKHGRTSDYAHDPGPGSAIDSHDAYDPQGEDAKDHLLVLHFEYAFADYLHLGREAHRRARVNFSEKEVSAVWIVP